MFNSSCYKHSFKYVEKKVFCSEPFVQGLTFYSDEKKGRVAGFGVSQGCKVHKTKNIFLN